jgi:hypothetical protein
MANFNPSQKLLISIAALATAISLGGCAGLAQGLVEFGEAARQAQATVDAMNRGYTTYAPPQQEQRRQLPTGLSSGTPYYVQNKDGSVSSGVVYSTQQPGMLGGGVYVLPDKK